MRSLLRDPDEAPPWPSGHPSRHDAGEEQLKRSWDRPAAGGSLAGARRTADADVSQRDGVVIVTPAGALPDPLPEMLAERLEGLIAARPVIVDLSGIVVVSAAPVVGLAGWIVGASHPDQSCAVCARPSARALLRKWHITRCLAVFGSIGDALQARRYAHDGYGPGWCPDPRGSDRPDPSVVHPRSMVERRPRVRPLHPDRAHQPA
jgi:hypothetical protein